MISRANAWRGDHEQSQVKPQVKHKVVVVPKQCLGLPQKATCAIRDSSHTAASTNLNFNKFHKHRILTTILRLFANLTS